MPLGGIGGLRWGFPKFALARSSKEKVELVGKNNGGGPCVKLHPPDVNWSAVTGGFSVAAMPNIAVDVPLGLLPTVLETAGQCRCHTFRAEASFGAADPESASRCEDGKILDLP